LTAHPRARANRGARVCLAALRHRARARRRASGHAAVRTSQGLMRMQCRSMTIVLASGSAGKAGGVGGAGGDGRSAWRANSRSRSPTRRATSRATSRVTQALLASSRRRSPRPAAKGSWRRCSSAGATSPSSPAARKACANSPSAPPSIRPFRDRPRISSSSPWYASRSASSAAACRRR